MTDDGTSRTWFDEFQNLSPEEIALRLQSIWNPHPQGTDYMKARRETLSLYAQAKLTQQMVAAVNALQKTGRGLTFVGIALAAIQAFPVLEGWYRSLLGH